MTTRWTAAARKKAFAAGHALAPRAGESEPRFPIEDCDDVENAALDVGRLEESERPEVRRFVTRRAIELECVDRLPSTWRLQKVETT